MFHFVYVFRCVNAVIISQVFILSLCYFNFFEAGCCSLTKQKQDHFHPSVLSDVARDPLQEAAVTLPKKRATSSLA